MSSHPFEEIVAPRSIGNTGVRRTTCELERTDTGFEATIIVEGSIASLKAAVTGSYKLGTSISVLDVANLEITKSRLETKPGNLGVLTVTATRERTDADDSEDEGGEDDPGGTTPPSTPEPAFHMEVDFSTITRPISENVAFTSITATEWEAIRRWQSLESNSAYSGRYAAFQAPTAAALAKEGGPDAANDNDWAALEASHGSAKYAELVSKGVEEYMVVVPVIRKTSVGGSVAASRAGQRDTPPQFDNLAGAWLKTADRWTRDSKRGKWTHSEEWTGFESLDSTLYPTTSSGGSSSSSS